MSKAHYTQAGANHPVSTHSRGSGRLLPIILAVLIACTLASLASGQSNAQAPAPSAAKPTAPSDAQKAFDRLKTMAGSWQGAIMGTPIGVTIRLASSGTAVLHEATADGNRPPQHEITMFYVEGDRLFATHHCDAGNRGRLEGKLSLDGTAIEFTLLDVAGGTNRGLLKRFVFNLIDENKHVIEGIFVMPDGKPLEMRGEFQRTQ